jgi:P-loop containing dynein motor region
MTIFMDDLSMPEINAWGDQPTLEMVRLIVEWGGFCFLDKDKRGDFKVMLCKLHKLAHNTVARVLLKILTHCHCKQQHQNTSSLLLATTVLLLVQLG